MLKLLVRVFFTLVALLGIAIIGVFVLITVYNKPRPTTGDEAAAEVMLESINHAINQEAWEQTGAIRWNFGGRQQHIWDRARGLSQVTWGEYKVLQHLNKREGVVFKNEQQLAGAEAQAIIEKAWGFFINDSFWLQPFSYIQNEDITRSVIQWEGEEALFVEYASGGVTPGDAYLYLIDKDTHLPYGWRMWVQIVPVGGLWSSWEDWTSLSTGAKIATKHNIAIFNLMITDVAAASDIGALTGGQDPFLPLLSNGEQPPTTPTSQPANALDDDPESVADDHSDPDATDDSEPQETETPSTDADPPVDEPTDEHTANGI